MNAALPADIAVLPEPDPKVRGLKDFSDRLSPMLVKELRQGMRSPIFVWGLISMNLFLAMVVWLTMASPEERDLHRAFFGGYCFLVCVLLPLRGSNALHEELRGNTIDTLVLTHLSGWRITLGKWVAVAAQQVLASITVLPYLIVRYFAGGLNVPLELAWLGIFLLLGVGAAAVLTGLSWLKFFLLRAAVMLGMTAATGGFCISVLHEMYGYRNEYFIDELYAELGWKFFVIAGIAILHLMFFTLDLGAAQVAGMAENRSTRRRVVGLSVIAVYIALPLWSYRTLSSSMMSRSSEALLGMGTALAVGTGLLLILQSLLEKPVNLAPVLQPFIRKGWIGRLAGRFLYPGWATGVLFSGALLLSTVLVMGAAIWNAWEPVPEWAAASPSTYYSSPAARNPLNLADWPLREWSILVCGFLVVPFTLPVPLMLHRWLFRKRMNWHLGTYVLMLTLMAAVELVLVSLASGSESAFFLKLGTPIPSMSWAWLNSIRRTTYFNQAGGAEVEGLVLEWEQSFIIGVTLAVGAFWWLMALVQSLKVLRETTAAEQEIIGETKRATLLPPTGGTGAA